MNVKKELEEKLGMANGISLTMLTLIHLRLKQL